MIWSWVEDCLYRTSNSTKRDEGPYATGGREGGRDAKSSCVAEGTRILAEDADLIFQTDALLRASVSGNIEETILILLEYPAMCIGSSRIKMDLVQ